MRAKAVEPGHPKLSIAKQCELLGISRSAYYYKPEQPDDKQEFALLKAILELLTKHPFYGYRKIAMGLADLNVTRKQVRRIMKRAGLRAIYPGKRTSMAAKQHKKYPYLLRNKTAWLPNQVWATDITYIKLAGGDVYLAAIIDLYSRKILAWQVSNTLDTGFCIAVLEEAIARYGIPAIFNTDQGCQFTADAFIAVLERHEIRISMDGVNRALDNIFIERFWRSLKYEDIYLNDYRTMAELKAGILRYMKFYNEERFHASHAYDTPNNVYEYRFLSREEKTKRNKCFCMQIQEEG